MKEFLPFIDSRLHVKWDEKVGFGVYAKDFIQKDTYVEIAPAIIFDKPEKKEFGIGDFMRSIETTSHSDPLGPFFKYVLAWQEQLALPLGWVGIYNHSDNNNCEFSTNIVDELIGILTVKDIEKDSQLTVNYGPDWFTSREIEKLNL